VDNNFEFSRGGGGDGIDKDADEEEDEGDEEVEELGKEINSFLSFFVTEVMEDVKDEEGVMVEGVRVVIGLGVTVGVELVMGSLEEEG
ncbi:hypothetical protein HMI55_004958, partial [Coelomomyces lativittatus]